ncbi:MAG: (2Fe-2S)-binding protein [Bacteroidota bacterium]
MELSINGKKIQVEVEKTMPLLWVLRDELNMTGTKFGCGISACGACTVHIDGKAQRSCIYPVAAAEGKEVTTIEGIKQGETFSAVQQAWIKHQVPQCGYCQSGMIMAVESLLAENPSPTQEEIGQSISNICRCGTYQRIKEAISTAIDSLQPEETIETVNP